MSFGFTFPQADLSGVYLLGEIGAMRLAAGLRKPLPANLAAPVQQGPLHATLGNFDPQLIRADDDGRRPGSCSTP